MLKKQKLYKQMLFCVEKENKLLDTFNTERYTILASKFIKMRAPNMSI